MKNIIDRALRRYENAGIVIQMKARFLFVLYSLLLILIAALFFVNLYIAFINPVKNAPDDINIIITIGINFLCVAIIMALLLSGRFNLSSHMAIIVTLAIVWLIMFTDTMPPVARLDTIVFIITILALLALTDMKAPYIILAYGAVNLAVFLIFVWRSNAQLNLPENVLIDYISDNVVALIFITIITFSVYRINQEALRRAERELAERDSAEKALRQSEERYRTLANSIPDIVYSVDRKGVITMINDEAIRPYGFRPEEITGRLFPDIIHPDDRARTIESFTAAMREKREFTRGLEFRIIDKSGTVHWMELNSHTRFDDAGNIAKDEGVLRNITDRKAADEQIMNSLQEKEVLLKEVHHRVKNNFQVIMSLLNLQANNISDERVLRQFNDAANRIRAMALVHEKLYQSENISKINYSKYIDAILDELQSYYNAGRRSIVINVDAEDIYLNIDQAIPCGLIMNELVTNAFKYAFPGESGSGTISVRLQRRVDDTIDLSVSDNGIGLPENFEETMTASLGLNLVTLLAKQLRGSYRIDRQGGTTWTISFPLRK